MRTDCQSLLFDYSLRLAPSRISIISQDCAGVAVASSIHTISTTLNKDYYNMLFTSACSTIHEYTSFVNKNSKITVIFNKKDCIIIYETIIIVSSVYVSQ